MKELIRAAMIIGLLHGASGLMGCSGGDASEGASESRSARAHRMVEDGATLLDVRTPAEFEGGHVEGAMNVPLQSLTSRMNEVPDDQPVVVYCLSGGRSASAARALESRGYEVLDLGAMSNW